MERYGAHLALLHYVRHHITVPCLQTLIRHRFKPKLVAVVGCCLMGQEVNYLDTQQTSPQTCDTFHITLRVSLVKDCLLVVQRQSWSPSMDHIRRGMMVRFGVSCYCLHPLGEPIAIHTENTPPFLRVEMETTCKKKKKKENCTDIQRQQWHEGHCTCLAFPTQNVMWSKQMNLPCSC